MAKQQTNLLVGAQVLIDWPCRWKHARPELVQDLKAEAAAKEAFFGETGTIVASDPGEPRGNAMKVLIGSGKYVGELEDLYEGALTVLQLPPNPNARTEDLLSEILNELRSFCGAKGEA